MSGGGGSSGGFESYLPIAAALAATVMTDGAAAPELVEAMGSEAAAGAVVGGGVGALTGGGVAALTGQNVGQNALMGGLGGATLGYGMAPGVGAGAGTGVSTGVSTASAPTVAGASANLAPTSIGFGSTGAVPTGVGSLYAGAAPSTFAPGVLSPAASSVLAGTTPAATSLIPGISNTTLGVGAGGLGLAALMKNDQSKYGIPNTTPYMGGNLSKFTYDPNTYSPDVVRPPSPLYKATYADGGLLQSGPANVNFMGTDMYPQSQQNPSIYATPTQMPASAQTTASLYEPKTNPLTGDEVAQMAGGGVVAFDNGGMAYDPYGEIQQQAMLERLSGLPQLVPTASAKGGKIHSLGSYSDGGQMLKGPGDGMSDSIPATIQNKQPARLADNEFVVPADVVSHIGNGSSDAGAKKLYAMMDKVRKARTGKTKQAPKINADKYMPA